MVPDCGDRCLFIFVWARRLFFDVFPFPVCKALLIGDWYENRRGARNTIILLIIRQYYWRTDAPCANRNGGPNRKRKLLAHRAWSALPIGGGGHRCANKLAHWKRNNLHVNNAGGVEAYILHVSKRHTEQFGPPRLFSYQSPINWALLTGHGNTLQKRRRLHKKINRHRSPRSGTTFEHLPASRRPSFFIGHYLITLNFLYPKRLRKCIVKTYLIWCLYTELGYTGFVPRPTIYSVLYDGFW